jgi:hypothetical protein
MSFDLNISNYTKNEVEEMFGLTSHYNKIMIEQRETKLRETILNNKQISRETQAKTLNFLVQAKNILLNGNLPPPPPQPHPQPKTSNEVTGEIYPFQNNFLTTPLQNSEEHMVQMPNRVIPELGNDPLVTNCSQFSIGQMNPFKRGSIIKNLNIDTRFRENYYTSCSTNFTFQLPMTFSNVISMQLTAIELPTSYLSVSKQYGNNYFTLSINNDPYQTTVVTIPDGTYSSYGISQIINNTLINLGGNYQYITFVTNTMSDILDSNLKNGTNQMIIDISGNQPQITTFTINFQADRLGLDDRNTPLPLKLGWLLGFRNGIYTNTVSYVSEGMVDVTSGMKYFFLAIDDYNNSVNNGFYSAFNASMLNNNILGRISSDTTYSSTGAGPYVCFPTESLKLITCTRQYFGPVNINNIEVQLLDQYGRVVDLNNMDFSFCLSLICSYDM